MCGHEFKSVGKAQAGESVPVRISGIVLAWNKFLECKGREENKIFLNGKDFFDGAFNSPYDAACAASAGSYRRTDEYVFIDREGFLKSFSNWDDETCPIDINYIDIDYLLQGLKNLQSLQDKEENEDISRAIHVALQEV